MCREVRGDGERTRAAASTVGNGQRKLVPPCQKREVWLRFFWRRGTVRTPFDKPQHKSKHVRGRGGESFMLNVQVSQMHVRILKHSGMIVLGARRKHRGDFLFFVFRACIIEEDRRVGRGTSRGLGDRRAFPGIER